MSRLFRQTIHYDDFTSDDIKQFALENGYEYIKSEAMTHEETGYYMGPTHYNEKVDVVRWTKDGVEYEFYTRFWNVEMAEKLGDLSDDKTRNRLFLGLTFSMNMPHQFPSVMVQTLTSRTIWNVLGFTELFVGKKVKLEGDFNQFFKVYTPSGEAPNAFLALAPDTMVKMLQVGSGMDFQFAGSRIYFSYDVRLQAKNFRNLWGFLGDNIKVNLDKDIHTKLLKKTEWLRVFDRSYEYSTDILRGFRALKQDKKMRSLNYIPLTGKNIMKILVTVIIFFATVIILAVWLPFVLAVLLLLFTLNSFYRYISWNGRRKKLLKDWDDGLISTVVR